MDDADLIWNRALDYDISLTRQGDLALRDVLTFDGAATNGGLLNAVESFSADPEFPLQRIIEGFRYFEMNETATLVSTCADRRSTVDYDELESIELEFDPQYPVPREDLPSALESRLAAAPQTFQPT